MPLEQAGVKFDTQGFSEFIRNIGSASKAFATMGEMSDEALESVRALGMESEKMGHVAKGLGNLSEGFGKVRDSASQSTRNLGMFGNAARDAAKGFGKLTALFAGIGNVIGGIAGLLAGIGLIATPLPLIDELLAMFGGPLLGTIIGGLAGLSADIGVAVADFFKSIISSVAQFLPKAIKKIYDIAAPIVGAFVTLGKKILSAIGNLVKTIFSAVKSLFSVFSGGGGYKNIGGSLLSAMVKFEILRQIVRKVIQEFKDYINVAAQAAITLQTLTIRLDNLIARQVRAAGITESYYKSIRIASGYTQELLGWIQRLAIATPFSEETISNTVSLAMAMGWSVEGTKVLTSAILDYSAAQGLSNDVMERIIYNFAQMRQAGKVTGTELRDLARGAFMPVNDILNEAARMLGIAADQMDEFRAAAADGTIDVETFFQAFINVVNRDFPDAARRMNFTFEAVIDNIRDLFRTLIGWNMIKPMLDSIARRMQNIIESINTPEVVRATKLLGMGLKYVVDMLYVAVDNIVKTFRQMFVNLGLSAPTLDSIIKSMIKFALTITKLSFIIQNFFLKTLGPIFREIGQKIENATDGISTTMEDFGDDAFSWGFNLIVQFGKGIMQGVSTFLTKVMRFLANMLSGWLKPHSPPLIAPDIDLWGLETIAEWLHGFTMADFGVLDSLKDSLKGALGALVDLGVIDEEVSADMYVSISADLIAAMEEFNRTGEMSQVIYDQLGSVAGVFGDELITLLNAQVEFAVATERVADAQEAYNAAVEATQQSTRTVNTMVKEYNALLRGGADQAILEARLAELNAAEMQLALDREAEQAAENELQAAEDYLDVVEEMVQLQEELIQQLIDLAQAQADAAQAASGGGGGGAGGGEGGEAEDVDWGFGNLGLGTGENLGDYFEALRLEAEDEFRRMWENMRVQFNTQFNTSFGPNSEFRRAWERFVNALRSYWDTVLVPAIGLPTWQSIADIWEGFDLFPGEGDEWNMAPGGPGDIIPETGGGGIFGVLNGIRDAMDRVRETWQLFIEEFTGPIKDMPKEGEEGIVAGTSVPFIDRIRLLIEDFKTEILPGLGIGLGESLIDGMLIGIGNKLMEIPAFAWWIHFMEKVDEFFGIGSPSKLFEEIGRSIVDGFFKGITEWLISTWGNTESALTNFVGSVLDFFGIEKGKTEGGESSVFKNIGGGLIVGLFSGIFTKLGELRENIGTWLGDHILNPVLEFLGISKGKESGSSSLFRDIGVSIVQGIIDGIESMIGELVAAALAAISAIPDVVKDFIGCDSPAKLFIPIGESIPEGLAVGITRGAGIAQDAMMNATNRLMMSAPQSRLNMATMQAPQVNRGSTVSFGDVSINNGMDWAVFKAQVQRVILEA